MRILVIEDSSNLSLTVRMALEAEGYEVCVALNGEEAAPLVAKGNIDLVLLDLETGQMSAMDFLLGFKQTAKAKKFKYPKIGLLSGSAKIASEAARLGADFFIRKPFEYEYLLRCVQAQSRAQSRMQSLDRGAA